MVERLAWFGLKFSEKKVLDYNAKLTKKKPKEESFINEVEGFQAATLLREDSSIGAKF